MPIGVEMQMSGIPPWGTCSLLEWEPSHGIARGNLQLPCLPWRPNTWPLVKEAIWLRKLMADVGLVQDGATSIMCDNQGCIALAKNPTHHSRTKHIDIQHHFIREKLESGEIGLKYCPTIDMVADVLTKALAKEWHQNLTRSMGLGVLDYLQSGSVEDYDVDIRNNVVDKCCKQSKT